MNPLRLPASPPSAAEVFRVHATRVYSLARRLLGNDADAEDVTQDVLLLVVRKLHTFRGEAEITTWLHRVTVNAALSHRRRQARHLQRPLDISPDQLENRHDAASPRPDSQALNRELRLQVEAALARLPQMYRDVLVLAGVEDLPCAEIAALLGWSQQAVKSRLHRARLLVRAALAPYLAL